MPIAVWRWLAWSVTQRESSLYRFIFGGIVNAKSRHVRRLRRLLRQRLRLEGEVVILQRTRHESRLGGGDIPILEGEAGDMVSQLEEGVFVGEARDFGIEDQRFDLALYREIVACPQAGGVRLPQPLDLDFPDGVRHPFSGLWFRGSQENFGRRLRQHDLGQMSVNHLKLGLALEAEHKRIL